MIELEIWLKLLTQQPYAVLIVDITRYVPDILIQALHWRARVNLVMHLLWAMVRTACHPSQVCKT